jgi:signal transduction histidine kinase
VRAPAGPSLLALAIVGLVLAGALTGLGADSATPDSVLILRQARVAETVDGRRSPPVAILLPLHWDVAHKGSSGSADFALDFPLPPGANSLREPHALFISRLGSAYEIEVNGVLLASAGSLTASNERWSAKYPVSVSIPSPLLAASNEIVVRIRADAGYRAGLAPVIVGPTAQVAPLARRAERLRIGLPLAASVLSLLVACFCVLLWWQQRDPLYAWAGWGETLWAVTVADTVIETAPLPWPYWGIALLLLRAAWAWSLYAIAQQVSGPRPRAEYWSMLAVQAGVLLCVLLMVAQHSTRPLLYWYAITFSLWAWVIVRLAVQAWRAPTSERFIIVLALVAVTAASVRDAWAGRFDEALYDESAWAKYVATLVGAALMWIVSKRFLQARSEALRLNASLAQRVAEKERELHDSFARLSEVERSRAVLAERERILRDMHDGVGSNLATAVRQLESGRSTPQEVVKSLRESMDHLKLSIDAMNLPAGDVNALLASLRYRLQPRIEGAGLVVRWDVEPLPRWSTASDEAMRHLQFLVLEVISNVLQHARATTLVMLASGTGAGIRIALADDGLGIGSMPAQGLGSLQVRADLIGARLTVDSAAPGTRVTIFLPSASA